MPFRPTFGPRRGATAQGGRGAGGRGPVVRARKSLGQHFLRDADILDRIVRESGVTSVDTVLEIGPGTGELTARLVQVAARVVAVELDETLARHVRLRLDTADNLAVIAANVLDFAPTDLLAEGGAAPPYSVVANIPYYITAPILRRFLGTPDPPRSLTLMVQKEVAQSIVAPPGSMSLLGASVQFYAEARLLFTVPRTAFAPQPNVDSAVVRIDLRGRPAVDVPDVDHYFAVVRAGFSQPRKQLHNALASRMWLPPDAAPGLLRSVGIDPMRRAQTLTLAEWATVADAVRHLRESSRRTPDIEYNNDGPADPFNDTVEKRPSEAQVLMVDHRAHRDAVPRHDGAPDVRL